jgi:hypothetical protein
MSIRTRSINIEIGADNQFAPKVAIKELDNGKVEVSVLARFEAPQATRYLVDELGVSDVRVLVSSLDAWLEGQ